MAMNSNMKMIAGAAGAAVLVAAAYMAGSHRAAAPQQPETPAVSTGANAADEAKAAKLAANESVAPKNSSQQRSNTGDNGGYAGNGNNNAVAQEQSRLCSECATVLSVHSENRQGKGTGIGAVGGAVVGGLLGNQLGGGTGRKVATVGGAVAGGFAGNEIEKRTRSTTVWVVKMRNADQTLRTMEFSQEPGVRSGDVVKASNGQLIRQ
jgi:outer membrane lipoprotein SlyB